uniref:Zinc finger CCCH domain-containing protein 49-like n=1 Tax=Tanacetum cinerariifolium TaxID=118510 RepID=A0A6L2P1D4_TANCI|nr:zinc finger CCCH domain-containing protein 49-like [Tanacetum cinerariifolium]
MHAKLNVSAVKISLVSSSEVNVQEALNALTGMSCLSLASCPTRILKTVTTEDESIRTLYVGGLDARVSEQDLRENFYSHGEIESVKMVLQHACAFVTYTTREAAKKAADELLNKLAWVCTWWIVTSGCYITSAKPILAARNFCWSGPCPNRYKKDEYLGRKYGLFIRVQDAIGLLGLALLFGWCVRMIDDGRWMMT